MTALFGNKGAAPAGASAKPVAGVSQGEGLTGDQAKGEPTSGATDANHNGVNQNGTSDGIDEATRETAQEHNDQGGKDARLDAKLHPAGTPEHPQKTAEEVGLDLDAAARANQIEDAHNLNRSTLADNVEVVYSSHPIANFTVGPFHFSKGVLKFTGKEKDGLKESDFKKVLEDLPAVDRSSIRKVSIDAAEDLVAKHRSQFGGSNAIDSAAGRDALERLHRLSPLVGTTPIGHAALPMEDNNKPVTVDNPTPTEADSKQG